MVIYHDVEQRSPEWYALRAGLPTASEFNRLVTGTGRPSEQIKTYALTLAAEKIAGEPIDAWQGNQWSERGKELEAEAREAYEFISGNAVEQTGFVSNDLWGCSPDGLLSGDGLLEIKCLKAENHLRACLLWKDKAEIPLEYRAQVQGQLAVTGRQYCDLFFYHPVLPATICRQEPDEEFISLLRKQAALVIEIRDDIIEKLEAT